MYLSVENFSNFFFETVLYLFSLFLWDTEYAFLLNMIWMNEWIKRKQIVHQRKDWSQHNLFLRGFYFISLIDANLDLFYWLLWYYGPQQESFIMCYRLQHICCVCYTVSISHSFSFENRFFFSNSVDAFSYTTLSDHCDLCVFHGFGSAQANK